MSRTPLDILNLFVVFPGDLLFFLLVIALSLGALFLAFGHRSRFPYEHSTRRYLIASAALVVVWLVMLGAAVLAQSATLDANRFMPPLERLAFAVTLTVLAWAFLSADFVDWRNRSNLFIIGLTLVLTLLYLNTAGNWLAESARTSAFNRSAFALIWSAAPVTIAIFGALLTLLNARSILDAPLKILFFLLLIVGNGFDLYRLSQGDASGSYLGGSRLAYVAGLILLPMIIYRLAVALLENSLVEVVLAASQPSSALGLTPSDEVAPVQESLSASASSWNFAAAPVHGDSQKLLNAIGIMLDKPDGRLVPEQIVKSTLESIGADVCVLIHLQENHYADVTAGYDRVADQTLRGISLNLSEQPTLLEASKRGEQTILFPEYHADELQDLFRRLNLSPLSNVYVQPLSLGGDLIAVLLVTLPYRQTDLSVQEIEALRDIGIVAAHILAWSSIRTESSSQAEEQFIDMIADKPGATTVDPSALDTNRKELEGSLDPVVGRSGRLISQMAELKQQLQQQQVRMLDNLAAKGDSGAVRRLTAIFDEQAHLRDVCELSARDLLDAETVLRVRNPGSGESLAQVIREYLHKEYNLIESARDRLRRQINAVLVMGKTAATDGVTAILQSLADETAQLELERDQQQRRLDSIAAKLESLGISGRYSSMTQLLIQLSAERETLGQQLNDVNEDRAALVKERRKRMAPGGGDLEELQQQLRHLSADHDQLLNAREDMRREQQQLQAKLHEAEAEQAELQAQNVQLNEQLSASAEGHEVINQRIQELTEERDNLLKLRDQLTAKVNAAVAEGADRSTDTDAQGELEELRATIERLAEQREELALDLSDARRELESARETYPQLQPDSAETTIEYRPWQQDTLSSVIEDLHRPLTSLSDYTDLLLAESLGILGSAQQQVLRLMSDHLGKLDRVIDELQKAVDLDSPASRFPHGDIDVMSVIDEVIRATSGRLGEKELQIELSLADHLPPISADANGLIQILTRLVNNASDVSPLGSQINISAKADRLHLPDAAEPADVLIISVTDRGGGIAPADLPRVFARKYRSAYPSIDGLSDTGVGMSIARAYVRALDGDLWVTSDLNAGSVFHLALPLQLAASIED
ncbi:MAG: ATP-binding protein [Chloroflexi bacterium]|nr:ATP-binding protein [Chloroflexota bacterium]